MAASTKHKFDAAVNVIKSLPKNGSFQPSQELMLEFYGFYKQATEGACSIPRPSFWEVVKKAKWDAWNKLGSMSREEAMLCYVEELKKIIETMPQTQMVAEFMETLGTFYELVEERPLYDGQGRSLSDADVHAKCNGVVEKAADISRDLSAQLAATEEELRMLGNDGEEVGEGSVEEARDDEHQDSAIISRTVESEDSELDNSGMITGPVKNNDGATIDSSGDVRVERADNAVHRTNDESISPSRPSELGVSLSRSSDLSISPSRPSDQSESDGEEFCDSTDQINQENVYSTPKRVEPRHEMLLKVDGGRQEMSPLVRDYLPYSPVIPRLSQLRHLPLSDSLRVNSPGEESLNASLGVSVSRVCPEDTLQSHDEMDESRIHPGDRGSAQSRTGSLDQSRGRRGLFRPVGVAGGSSLGDGHLSATPSVNEQIATTLLRLQQDMYDVKSRLDTLERGRHKTRESLWGPLRTVNRSSVFWVVVWPFVVHILLTAVRRTRHRHQR